MRFLIAILLVLCVTGCATAVGGSVVYVLGKNAETMAKRNKRYSAIEDCFVPQPSSPYEIAERIFHGAVVPEGHEIILEHMPIPIGYGYDDPPPHYIAYAYYAVAYKMKDMRAEYRLRSFANVMKEKEFLTISDWIDFKYLPSFLNKCFNVPTEYYIIELDE